MAAFMFQIQLLLLAPFALSTQVKLSESSVEGQIFTNNPVCLKHKCTNPLTPGLTELPRLEALVWQCTAPGDVWNFLSFCSAVVNYDAAVPSPSDKSMALDALVAAQEAAASTMFVMHLAGIGYEAWDFKEQRKIDEDICVKRVQEMVCYTYFPKSEANCKAGDQTAYSRPCRNSCGSYLESCEVECCDGSDTCVFDVEGDAGQRFTGYVNSDGPSALCTGSGSSRLGVPMMWLLLLLGLHAAAADGLPELSGKRGLSQLVVALVLAFCAVTLQGCFLTIPEHTMPNWLRKTNYLVTYEYVPPGQYSSAAMLNSCSPGASARVVCSGRGQCRPWATQPLSLAGAGAANSVAFCHCDPEWADPECRTRRKSQLKAFALSVFGGFLGADHFFLGFMYSGLAKLFTLGGFGTWWLFDIVRVGCAPVYATDYRVYNDLPHYVFVLTVCGLFAALGLVYSLESYVRYRKLKRAEVMMFHARDEDLSLPRAEDMDRARYGSGQSGFGGYGATLQKFR